MESSHRGLRHVAALALEVVASKSETQGHLSGCEQGWAKLVLIAVERYSVALKRLTFNLR